jgi:hypothetical protein
VQSLADTNPPSTINDVFAAITVEVIWSEDEVSHQARNPEEDVVDLDTEWTHLRAADGVLFTNTGLMMRRGTDVIKIRAIHTY